jgi:hypothetical protein
MVGWEATAWIGQFGWPTELFLKWQEEVLDLAVDDLGINRMRLELQSGTENQIDYFSMYMKGDLREGDYFQHINEIVNDNDDPFVINPDGFKFSYLDNTIDYVVLPLKQRLESKGEKLYVNLNVVDFANPADASNVKFADQPDEYAEFVLAAFLHLEEKYEWTPDAVEVVLEPAKAGWDNGTNVGNALAAAGERLKENGFTPDFIGPSNLSMAEAIHFFDEMVQVPGVLDYLSEFSYHRYAGVSEANLRTIAKRARQYNIDTAHLEKIGASYQDLHADLKIAENSSWAQYALADVATDDQGGLYFTIDIADPEMPVVKMASRTKFLRQYFKFIRRGAVRIEAATDNQKFDPVAFVNTNGTTVVVIKVDAYFGGRFSVRGLPARLYGIKYTTANDYDVDLPDVDLTSNEDLTATIPDRGVVTIYAKPQ